MMRWRTLHEFSGDFIFKLNGSNSNDSNIARHFFFVWEKKNNKINGLSNVSRHMFCIIQRKKKESHARPFFLTPKKCSNSFLIPAKCQIIQLMSISKRIFFCWLVCDKRFPFLVFAWMCVCKRVWLTQLNCRNYEDHVIIYELLFKTIAKISNQQLNHELTLHFMQQILFVPRIIIISRSLLVTMRNNFFFFSYFH